MTAVKYRLSLYFPNRRLFSFSSCSNRALVVQCVHKTLKHPLDTEKFISETSFSKQQVVLEPTKM